jgi:ABC-type polysaccharide/polyol phosphate export permease
MLRSFWQARELAVTLARRDFYSRYRRAMLGVMWAVAMPVIQASVLALVFTKVARLSLPGNAFVFVYSGTAAWAFFSQGLGIAATSVVDGATLASRIYFPRLVLPLVSVLSGSFLLLLNYTIALIAAWVTGSPITLWALLVPASMLLTLLITFLAAAALSAIHVYFRDTRYFVQAALLVTFYLTPVFYPMTQAPGKLRIVDEINPMTGIIELGRRGTVGADPIWVHAVGITGIWIVALAGLTVWLYSRFDRYFSDLM